MSEESVIETSPRLVITQDNDTKHCRVVEVNEAAAERFGSTAESLQSQSFESLLSEKTLAQVHDMLEYEADAPDLHDVLSKVRDVRFKSPNGGDMAIEYALSRVLSRDANSWFELTFPSAKEARAEAQLKDYLRAALESRLVVDGATGLPNRETCLHFYKTATSFAQNNDIQAAFAAVRMDRFEKSMENYGQEGCDQLSQHMANTCKRLLDDDDIVCVLNEKTLAIFLLNFSRESARVLLNRMRWHLRSHRIVFGGKQDFSVTVSIAFDMLTDEDGDGALERCEGVLSELDQDERNQLIEPAA